VSKPVAYGGQAVVEGVMMRGQRFFAIACRRPNGEIVVREEPVPAFFTRYRWATWPFFRGVFALADAMVLGMKSLLYSANLQLADQAAGLNGRKDADPGGASQVAAPAAGATGSRSAAPDAAPPTGPAAAGANGGEAAASAGNERPAAPKSVAGIAIAGTAVGSMALGVGLFVLLPTLAAGALRRWFDASDLTLNLAEGGIRVAIMLGYIAAIGRMAEVKRLFKYHGAEHKAINGLELEGAADVDVAMRQSTIHPRCGTNFLLTVLMVKVLVASFFGWPEWWLRIGIRLAVLPVVAALSYEVIRLAGRYRHFTPLQLVVAPGLLTQRLTTNEPEREMVEVAVRALRSVMRREGAAVPEEERLPAQV
jgi:uncharacterized protein YqhQ